MKYIFNTYIYFPRLRFNFIQNMIWRSKGQGQAIPVHAWTDTEISRRFRVPDFKTPGTWRWKVCQFYAPAAFIPRKYSWFLFLL